MEAEILMFDNGASARRRPRLSVLIPYSRRDPTGLIEGLGALDTPMELVVLDNGSGDKGLANRVTGAILGLDLPARFVRLPAKLGRASARTRLAHEARAERRVFLDAEASARPASLARALAMVEREGRATERRRARRPAPTAAPVLALAS